MIRFRSTKYTKCQLGSIWKTSQFIWQRKCRNKIRGLHRVSEEVWEAMLPCDWSLYNQRSSHFAAQEANKLVCSKFSLLHNLCSFYNNLGFRYIWLFDISIRLPFYRPVLITELSAIYTKFEINELKYHSSMAIY